MNESLLTDLHKQVASHNTLIKRLNACTSLADIIPIQDKLLRVRWRMAELYQTLISQNLKDEDSKRLREIIGARAEWAKKI